MVAHGLLQPASAQASQHRGSVAEGFGESESAFEPSALEAIAEAPSISAKMQEMQETMEALRSQLASQAATSAALHRALMMDEDAEASEGASAAGGSSAAASRNAKRCCQTHGVAPTRCATHDRALVLC